MPPLSNPITEPQIPQPIARDAEVTAAINAHLAASDPHAQYLLQSEGDARYEYRAGLASKSIAGPLNYPANTWSSLGTFPGFPFGVQGSPSAIVVGISFNVDVVSPWQQSVCAGLLGPCWWQPASVADQGVRVPLEVHNLSGFFINLRAGRFSQDLRDLQINPESAILIPSTGRVEISLKRFF
ncbi:hypothetical protein [Microcoleus asticus]|uniref:Uncharacterized protein n=1 Tax=Microcoleus asticus IPMA8 TaxID=2563858 RepID=A0ABX2D4F8_9CYAN|nr:hypothetical protein [Microcoleus asticus]NQE37527.1 hypothetical protein [Microcoleus asticus IPMA8]